MGKIVEFGEDVPDYDIPVLNEREIRAGAGILFVLMFIAILTAIMKSDFTLLKYAVTIFLTDISIRVLINPRYAPSLILGRLMVRKQTPEYVGAQQKKFAWIIGMVLALVMFALQVVVNSFSPITALICLICLIFLFFETSFGICLGCFFYSKIYKEKAQQCPGEVCDPRDRQAIQKTSGAQKFILVGFVAYMFLMVSLLNDFYSQEPFDLFGLTETAQVD